MDVSAFYHITKAGSFLIYCSPNAFRRMKCAFCRKIETGYFFHCIVNVQSAFRRTKKQWHYSFVPAAIKWNV